MPIEGIKPNPIWNSNADPVEITRQPRISASADQPVQETPPPINPPFNIKSLDQFIGFNAANSLSDFSITLNPLVILDLIEEGGTLVSGNIEADIATSLTYHAFEQPHAYRGWIEQKNMNLYPKNSMWQYATGYYMVTKDVLPVMILDQNPADHSFPEYKQSMICPEDAQSFVNRNEFLEYYAFLKIRTRQGTEILPRYKRLSLLKFGFFAERIDDTDKIRVMKVHLDKDNRPGLNMLYVHTYEPRTELYWTRHDDIYTDQGFLIYQQTLQFPYENPEDLLNIQSIARMPVELTIEKSDAGSIISFPSYDGFDYQLESSTDFIQWEPLGSPVEGTNDLIRITVPDTRPKVFFRVRINHPWIEQILDLPTNSFS